MNKKHRFQHCNQLTDIALVHLDVKTCVRVPKKLFQILQFVPHVVVQVECEQINPLTQVKVERLLERTAINPQPSK
jgi:hypothetical protein